jgi:maltose O-acetyltransferase
LSNVRPSSQGVAPGSAVVDVHPMRRIFRGLWFQARLLVHWLLRGHPATSSLLPVEVRRIFLRLGHVQLGSQITGLQRCWFEGGQVSIGTGSFVNSGCWFEGEGRIVVGRDCLIGPEVMIVTSVHEIGPDRQVARESTYRDVHIGDGCWLGARAMILPGVTIGAGTVIGAGAVVTKDCEPGAVYVGVPAQKVR